MEDNPKIISFKEAAQVVCTHCRNTENYWLNCGEDAIFTCPLATMLVDSAEEV